MSKHIFYQTVGEAKYEVQIGWDRPLQRFYFVISPFVSDSERGEVIGDPVASNLFLPNPDSLLLFQVQAVCEDYGLLLPKNILLNVEDDRINNVVNKVKVY